MTEDLEPTFDPIQESISHLLAIIFPKAKSSYYPLVIKLAQGAYLHREAMLGMERYHMVVFAKTQADAGRAQTMLRYVHRWKDVQVFADGNLIDNTFYTHSVLKCYLQACTCNDWKSHCFETIDDPSFKLFDSPYTTIIDLANLEIEKMPKPDRYIFPCKLLLRDFRFDLEHPSSPQDQIQAGAIKNGCHWCPNFDEKNYRKVSAKERMRLIKDEPEEEK